MAAGDLSNLNGMFKVVYADKLLDLVPDFAVLQKLVDFAPADKLTGNYYAQPVALTHEAGFTYLGTSGVVSSLNAAVSHVTKEAQVTPSEMILRSQLSYTALSRAASAGQRAFKRASSWLVEEMNNSMRKRLEIELLYGQTGVATIDSVSTNDLTITTGSWAGGIWAGAEGMTVECYSGITGSDTKRATFNGLITAINSDTRVISVTDGTNAVAGDVLYFAGSRTASAFNGMAGLDKIVTNTGTLFNIAANTYALWKGSTVSSVGALSFTKIQDAISKAVNKGLMEKCLVLLSPKAWAVLASDQASLRVFDGSYSSKKFENGSESIVFHGPNGALEIRAHPFCKDGDAFILPMERVCRLGSVDLTFSVPGFDQEFFRLVTDKNAVELQCMADQAIFLEKPAHAVKMTGITYS